MMPQFETLLTEKLTRKEFLLRLGILILTIAGVGRFFAAKTSVTAPSKKTVKTSFGSGAYGV